MSDNVCWSMVCCGIGYNTIPLSEGEQIIPQTGKLSKMKIDRSVDDGRRYKTQIIRKGAVVGGQNIQPLEIILGELREGTDDECEMEVGDFSRMVEMEGYSKNEKGELIASVPSANPDYKFTLLVDGKETPLEVEGGRS